MTAVIPSSALARQAAGGISGRMLANAALAMAVFLGGFVLFEPAPYELFFIPVIFFWTIAGLRFPRSIMPLMLLLLVFAAGGLIASTQVTGWEKAPLYMAVSIFLALTSMFLAAVIADEPDRLGLIMKVYVASAAFAAFLGILGYFSAFPGAYELFTKFHRARGPFQDPNVFGPFLVLPTVWLARTILTRPIFGSLGHLALLALLVLGIFLSFSRAAWGLTAVGLMLLWFLLFFNEPAATKRLRLLALAGSGIVVVALLIMGALLIPQVSELFAERAKLVQDYDGERLGRFARHIIGFKLAMDNPLGIGALEFSKRLPEDPHNTFLKSLVAYGWLGFVAYVSLVVWTFARAFPILFKRRPWVPYLQCAYVVFTGHVFISMVIDIDHWRHYYLILGVIWGIIALDVRASRPKTALPARAEHAKDLALRSGNG